jgi:hypothetical protein
MANDRFSLRINAGWITGGEELRRKYLRQIGCCTSSSQVDGWMQAAGFRRTGR